MMRKQLICYLLMTLLVVPIAWSQERAIRPANQQPNADVRQALVIGNAAYTSAGMLRNPVNDARAISNTLSQLGFAVTTITNADQRKMEQSIRDFGKQLRDYKGVGLFYYAGHGMQFDGENYLLPTDIDPSTETDVRYDAVPLGKMLGQMQNAGNRMNLVVLDACRNNPFARSFRTFNPGLAQVIAPEGTFISFATAPGKVAADGDGRNGLFTSKLLRHLKTPGLKLEEVFKRTAADVYRDSNKQQVPWVQFAVIGDFYFVPDDAAPAAVAIPAEEEPKRMTLYMSDPMDKSGTILDWKTKADSSSDLIYIGEVKNSIPNGEGFLIYPKSFSYIGNFKDGVFHGRGKMESENGDKYVGEWVAGLMHGQGTFTYPNGQVYSGEWKNSLRHGHVELVSEAGNKYVGEFKNGLRDGKGTQTSIDGSKYVGEWENDQINGVGTLTLDNGDEYVGSLKDGLFHGSGMMLYKDGRKYIGEYEKGEFHGAGVFTVPGTFTISGNFKNGLQHGEGKVITKDGDEINGTWENGKFVK